MALIDVSELMVDPDFVDACSIITRTPTVNSYGEQVIVDAAPIDTVGSVQPADTETIEKLPEALRSRNVKSFFIKGVIPTLGTGKYPSILSYQGKRYQIIYVADFSNFGAGYTEGACVLEEPAP